MKMKNGRISCYNLIHFSNNNFMITRILLIMSLLFSGTILAQANKSLYDVALVKAKAGKLPQAILDLNSFIRLNPKHIPSRELRADINNQLGEYQKALDDNVFILNNDINASPEKKASYQDNIGYDYLLLGEYTKGRHIYQSANAVVPNDINRIFNIGYSFKKEKMYDSSVVYFDKVLALDKSHSLSLRNKIQALHLNEKSEEALSLCDEFLNKKQFDIDIILTRAAILKTNGKIDLALNDFQRALVYEPEDFDALIGVSECYVLLGYYDEDLKLKQRMVEVFKANKQSNTMISSSLYLLGSAYKFLEDYENAIKSFNEAEALNPKDVLILLERGLAKASNKDLEGACQDFKKASIMDEKKTSEYEEFVSDDAEYAEFAKYCSIF